jgi:hypothetical protein
VKSSIASGVIYDPYMSLKSHNFFRCTNWWKIIDWLLCFADWKYWILSLQIKNLADWKYRNSWYCQKSSYGIVTKSDMKLKRSPEFRSLNNHPEKRRLRSTGL